MVEWIFLGRHPSVHAGIPVVWFGFDMAQLTWFALPASIFGGLLAWLSHSGSESNMTKPQTIVIGDTVYEQMEEGYWVPGGDATKDGKSLRELAQQLPIGAKPFGYEMGQKIEAEPDGVAESGVMVKFITQNPPAPFTKLVLSYTPNAGLGVVSGRITTESVDEYFTHFAILLFYLKDQYGEPDRKGGRDERPGAVVHGDCEWSTDPSTTENVMKVFLGSFDIEVDPASLTNVVTFVFANAGDVLTEAEAMRKR